LYEDGLRSAIQRGHLSAVGTAVLELQPLPAAQTRHVEPFFVAALPQLAQLGTEDAEVETAVTLALIATTLEAFDEAAVWYNEAIRRTAVDTSQYNQLRQSRNKLRTLWTLTGVNSADILKAVQAQLAEQLQTYPELIEDGVNHINKSVNVIVTKVLQTTAGRMVFARFPTQNEVEGRIHREETGGYGR